MNLTKQSKEKKETVHAQT